MLTRASLLAAGGMRKEPWTPFQVPTSIPQTKFRNPRSYNTTKHLHNLFGFVQELTEEGGPELDPEFYRERLDSLELRLRG